MRENKKNNKPPLASIILIQAAVLEHTGIKVKLDDLMIMLLEEGLITQGMVKFIEVPDLNKFGQSYTRSDKIYDNHILPVDKVVADWPSQYVEKELEIERNSTQD